MWARWAEKSKECKIWHLIGCFRDKISPPCRRLVADRSNFLYFGGHFVHHRDFVWLDNAVVQPICSLTEHTLFGNHTHCADFGVAVYVVFWAGWMDGRAFEWTVGVRVGVCAVGNSRNGRLGAWCFTIHWKHQVEAGLALGLSRFQVFYLIEAPQGLRRLLPSAINLFTRMVKTSSLAALIGVIEVVKVGQQIIENSLLTVPNASFGYMVWFFVLYFVICYPLSLLANRLEQQWES